MRRFTFSFASGHGSPSVLVLLHEKDEVKMSDSKFMTYVNNYLNNAPNGSDTALVDEDMRYHGCYYQLNTMTPDCNYNFSTHTFLGSGLPTFDMTFNSSNATFIQTYQDPNANRKIAGLYKFNKTTQRAQGSNIDRRVSYASAEYPWIESVYRYYHLNQAGGFDSVLVDVPGRNGLGHYILYWLWSGYSDCVDIDRRANAVEKPYGDATGSSYQFLKVSELVEEREIERER